MSNPSDWNDHDEDIDEEEGCDPMEGQGEDVFVAEDEETTEEFEDEDEEEDEHDDEEEEEQQAEERREGAQASDGCFRTMMAALLFWMALTLVALGIYTLFGVVLQPA